LLFNHGEPILQACEQLNAWLSGFENILKRMVPGNFDWFLHTMLFSGHIVHLTEPTGAAHADIAHQ
jgi:hypothetical protein